MLFCVVFGLIFCAAGAFVATGAVLRHIAGWRELPAAEQSKIRIRPLCRNIGGAIALAGVVFLAAAFLPGFREGWFSWALTCWLILCAADVIYIERSGRYMAGGR